MEQVVKQLEEAGITVTKFECGYLVIIYSSPPEIWQENKYEFRGSFKHSVYIVLDKFQGYDLISKHPGEVKYFRTISELIEHVKK